MMDLTTPFANFQHAQAMSAVELRVARKALDVQELQGEAAIQLIKAAAGSASNAGDSLVAAATGVGGQIDIYA